ITSTRPSSSRSAMLRPISPTPPRNTSRGPGRAEPPCLAPSGPDVTSASASEKVRFLQDLADPLALVLRRGDEREPGRSDRPADELERGLRRDRVAGDEQDVEDG